MGKRWKQVQQQKALANLKTIEDQERQRLNKEKSDRGLVARRNKLVCELLDKDKRLTRIEALRTANRMVGFWKR